MSEIEIRRRAKIAKINASKRIIFGVIYTIQKSGRPVVDAQGDMVSLDEIEKAAHAYLSAGRTMDVRHNEERAGYLVESLIVDPQKRDAMGLPPETDMAWWGAFKIENEVTWAAVISGELTEFSFGGRARRIPIERPANAFLHTNGVPDETYELKNLSIDSVSLVPAGAGVGTRVEVIKEMEKIKKEGMNTLAELEAALADKPELLAMVMSMLQRTSQAGNGSKSLAQSDEPEKEADESEKEEDAPEKAEDDEPEKEEEAVKSLKKELRSARQERESLAKALEAERRTRLVEKELTRTRSLFGDLLPEPVLKALAEGKAACELGHILSQREKELAEWAERSGRVLKESAAFHPLGSSRTPDLNSVQAEILEAAERLRKERPSLSKSAAVTQIYKSRPDLVERYKAERNAQ